MPGTVRGQSLGRSMPGTVRGQRSRRSTPGTVRGQRSGSSMPGTVRGQRAGCNKVGEFELPFPVPRSEGRPNHGENQVVRHPTPPVFR